MLCRWLQAGRDRSGAPLSGAAPASLVSYQHAFSFLRAACTRQGHAYTPCAHTHLLIEQVQVDLDAPDLGDLELDTNVCKQVVQGLVEEMCVGAHLSREEHGSMVFSMLCAVPLQWKRVLALGFVPSWA